MSTEEDRSERPTEEQEGPIKVDRRRGREEGETSKVRNVEWRVGSGTVVVDDEPTVEVCFDAVDFLWPRDDDEEVEPFEWADDDDEVDADVATLFVGDANKVVFVVCVMFDDVVDGRGVIILV